MLPQRSAEYPSCQKSCVSVASIDVRSRLIGSMESVPVDEPVIRLYTVPETSTGKSGRSFKESRSTWKVDLGDWGGPVTVTSSGTFAENRRDDETYRFSSNSQISQKLDLPIIFKIYIYTNRFSRVDILENLSLLSHLTMARLPVS